ncbi:MAG: sensor histidine kinase [Panacagrimonas sp.]
MQAEDREPIHSLRGRLLVALIGPLAVLFLIGGAASYGLAQYFADTVYDGWLFDSVSSLALEVDRTANGPFVDMPPATQRLFEWDVSDKTYFRISGARKGLIVGRTDIPAMTGDVDEYRGARLYDGTVDGEEVRIAALDLPAEDFGETVTVEVAETTRKRHSLARAILLSTLVPQLVLIVVAGAAIRRAVGHGLAPLRTIAGRLQARSHRQLSPIPEQGVPAEVRPLTGALNDLLSRLELALSAQRRFIAEAAHQLRTPLTAIKLQVEELGRESSLEEARPLLVSLRNSTDRAARLSNQLLSLARAEPDSGAAKPFAKVDLLSLVHATGAEWAPRALARGLDMHFSSESENAPIWVEGDADLLREAISNLLDNAIKYHSGTGGIHLRVSASPSPGIDVEDDGPGIVPELRPQMLRRFVRGGHGEGSGLGLPIAHEIARLHKGDLVLEDGPTGRGLRARLLFPGI